MSFLKKKKNSLPFSIRSSDSVQTGECSEWELDLMTHLNSPLSDYSSAVKHKRQRAEGRARTPPIFFSASASRALRLHCRHQRILWSERKYGSLHPSASHIASDLHRAAWFPFHIKVAVSYLQMLNPFLSIWIWSWHGGFRAGRGVDSGGGRPSGGPWPEWKQILEKLFFFLNREGEEGWGSLTLQIKACVSLSSSSFFHGAPNNTLMDYWCARSVWIHDRSVWGGTWGDLANKHRNSSFKAKLVPFLCRRINWQFYFMGLKPPYMLGVFALATWLVTWKQFSFYDILHLSLKGEILGAALEQVQVKCRGSRRPGDIEPEVLRIPKYPARPEEALL